MKERCKKQQKKNKQRQKGAKGAIETHRLKNVVIFVQTISDLYSRNTSRVMCNFRDPNCKRKFPGNISHENILS